MSNLIKRFTIVNYDSWVVWIEHWLRILKSTYEIVPQSYPLNLIDYHKQYLNFLPLIFRTRFYSNPLYHVWFCVPWSAYLKSSAVSSTVITQFHLQLYRAVPIWCYSENCHQLNCIATLLWNNTLYWLKCLVTWNIQADIYFLGA